MQFQFPNVVWGLSERKDGQMSVDLSPEEAERNRQEFFHTVDIDLANTVGASLVHGNEIVAVGEKDKGKIIPNIDGLVTNEKSLYLLITVADCAPVYFFDSQQKAVGLAHAGWRGVVKNISRSLVDRMVETCGSKASSIVAHVGPHIRECHFEIKEDVLPFFKQYARHISNDGGKSMVSLAGIVKEQLLKAGLKAENISTSNECTFDEKKYFSFRREKPEVLQTMVAYIGMK